MPYARISAPVTPERALLFHRGFELRLRASDGTFAFEIGHHDLTLHASTPDFGTPHAAERAARLFVDDALGAYDAATRALAA